MKEILGQLLKIWHQIKFVQKITIIATLLLVMLLLAALFFRSEQGRYTPLFASSKLQHADLVEIRDFLVKSGIPFEENSEAGFSVPKEHVARVRMELAAAGVPKQEHGKGFELFDSNTWIKGEKELQVLEMRALKGQLERDIAEFDNIKNASVILDLAPQRSFGAAQYKTKASVILTVMPGARLTTSELKAITFHLSGAVRGLEPNMIAISDTSGKLYKALDPENVEEPFSNAEVLLEEHVHGKIDAILTKMLGGDHYFTTVEATPERIAISILIDDGKGMRTEIERQIRAITSGFSKPVTLALDFVPFEKKKSSWSEKQESFSYSAVVLFSLILSGGVGAMALLFRRFRRKKQESEEVFFEVMTKVDLGSLGRAIQDENPETIATMLSYLEPKRAEALLMALPEKTQEEVLVHLSEMESEDA